MAWSAIQLGPRFSWVRADELSSLLPRGPGRRKRNRRSMYPCRRQPHQRGRSLAWRRRSIVHRWARNKGLHRPAIRRLPTAFGASRPLPRVPAKVPRL